MDERVVAEIDRAPAGRRFDCPECLENFVSPEALGSHLERHRPVGKPTFTPRGKPTTEACAKGCGRNFDRKRRRELNAHAVVCDGSPPLPPGRPERPAVLPPPEKDRQAEGFGRQRPETGDAPKESDVSKDKLPCRMGCEQKFVHPKWREKHEEQIHGAVGGEKPAGTQKIADAAKRFAAEREKRKAEGPALEVAAAAAGDGYFTEALAQLRSQRRELLARVPGLEQIEQGIAALEAIAKGAPTRPTPES